MQDENQRNIYIEKDFEAYRNTFSDDWCKRIDNLTDTKPKLSGIILDLILDWRSAAYTASLPATTLEMIKSHHDGLVNSNSPNSTLIRLTEALKTKLAREMPDEFTVDPSLGRRIQKSLIDTCGEIIETWDNDNREFEFSIEEHWNIYTEYSAFQLGLWGSQRVCYVSIFNAYDSFVSRVTDTVSIAQKTDCCRTVDREFKKYFSDLFGNTIKNACWCNNELATARYARHALSHAGGRETKNLKKQKHDFEIVDGKIHVTPGNTKALYSLLTDCVFQLSEKAVTMPEFD